MNKDDLIARVKVKLDEVSPFEEPTNFIAAGGDASYNNVKPILAYIEQELPNALKYCLQVLPTKSLVRDIDAYTCDLTITKKVGFMKSSESIDFSKLRLVRLQVPNLWKRDATYFITSEDAAYLLQQSPYIRGGESKPMVAYNTASNSLELYSFPSNKEDESIKEGVTLWSIDTTKDIADVSSPIEDLVAVKCAQLVLDIIGDAKAQSMGKEFERLVVAL